MEADWKRRAAERWLNERIDWQRRRKAPEGFDQAARCSYELIARSMDGEHGDQLLPELQAVFTDEFIDANPRWALLLLGWVWNEVDELRPPGGPAMGTWCESRANRLVQEHHGALPRPDTLAKEHMNTGFFPGWLRGWFAAAEARDA